MKRANLTSWIGWVDANGRQRESFLEHGQEHADDSEVVQSRPELFDAVELTVTQPAPEPSPATIEPVRPESSPATIEPTPAAPSPASTAPFKATPVVRSAAQRKITPKSVDE